MKRQQGRDVHARTKRARQDYTGNEQDRKERSGEGQPSKVRPRMSPTFRNKQYSTTTTMRDARSKPKTNTRARNRRDRRWCRGNELNVFGAQRRGNLERNTMLPYSGLQRTGSGRSSSKIANSRVDKFRTLCISNIRNGIPLSVIKDTLFDTFQPFGRLEVNIIDDGESKLAYLDFPSGEIAENAKCSVGKLVLFDTLVRVECVAYNSNRKVSNQYDSVYANGDISPPASSTGNLRPVENVRLLPVSIHDNYRAQDSNKTGWSHVRQDTHPEPKFPHHLDHIKPEDDAHATRTLFVGNLDLDITEQELEAVFTKYGELENIDIKRPCRGMGNAYAFIKFANLDMAHRAKVRMSGEFIGKYQCKIGYGKVSPTNCVWVGGLGSGISYDMLEREFDRFGVIRQIDWKDGSNHAFVLYDNTDAAQAACQQMRGFPLSGSKRRLRVDFADPSQISGASGSPNYRCAKKTGKLSVSTFGDDEMEGGNHRQGRDSSLCHDRDRTNGSKGQRHDKPRHEDDSSGGERMARPACTAGSAPAIASSSLTDPLPELGSEPNKHTDGECSAESHLLPLANVSQATSTSELAKCLPVVWSGALVLKNSSFAARMHLLSGNVRVVDTLMRDQTTTEMPVLRISQRLRLEPSKLDEVRRRMDASGDNGHSVLLAMPGNCKALENADSSVLQRPLRNLVSYLTQKDAAGVIMLPPNLTDCKGGLGVLHAFPPCEFGYSLLRKCACKLTTHDEVDNHLVVVVVRDS